MGWNRELVVVEAAVRGVYSLWQGVTQLVTADTCAVHVITSLRCSRRVLGVPLPCDGEDTEGANGARARLEL